MLTNAFRRFFCRGPVKPSLPTKVSTPAIKTGLLAPKVKEKSLRRKDAHSARSRMAGAELADGKFRSLYDLHLMEETGCDLSKLR